MELVTTSRLKAHRACPRLQHLRYDQGIRPVADSEPLVFGTLVHVGLEAWWKALGRCPLAAALDAMRAHYADTLATGTEPDDFRLARAEALLAGYDTRWAGEGLETLAVEIEFTAPLINPSTGAASRTFEIAGKIDAIVSDREGRVLIVEHKTSSEDISPGSRYWQRLRMDGQVSMYYAGAAALGYDVQGCLYDVLQTPRIQPLKATPEAERKYTSKPSKLKDGTIRPAGSLYANQREADETVDEYRARIMEAIAADANAWYQRGVVVRLDDEMREHAHDVWHTAQSLRDARRTGVHVRNPDACDRYHRLCEFFAICTGEASADDPTKFTRGNAAHPELTEQPAQQAKEEPDHDDDIFQSVPF